LLLADVEGPFLFAGPQGISLDAIYNPREACDQIVVAEGEDRVQVHAAPLDRKASRDHPLRAILSKECPRYLADGLWRRAFSHADEHATVSDRHDVSTFGCGQAEVL